MAINPPPPPWEVLQQVNEMVGNSGLKGEVDKSVRALAQSALSRLEVVSREEFDAQSEILKRTRERVVTLEAELEAMTKEFTVQAVISSFVAERAGADLSAFEVRQITVRGRAETMAVHLVPDARNLPGVEANAQKRRRGRVRVKAPA